MAGSILPRKKPAYPMISYYNHESAALAALQDRLDRLLCSDEAIAESLEQVKASVLQEFYDPACLQLSDEAIDALYEAEKIAAHLERIRELRCTF